MHKLPTTGIAARAKGSHKYFTGKACLRGHVAPRYAHNGQCTSCANEATNSQRRTREGKLASRTYYEKYRQETPHVVMFNSARLRAKRRGTPFDINPEDIRNVWPEDGLCPILKIPMQHNFNKNGSHTDASPSLDCIDPKKGYVVGNIVVCCFLANRVKNNVVDPNIFLKIAKWLSKQGTKK